MTKNNFYKIISVSIATKYDLIKLITILIGIIAGLSSVFFAFDPHNDIIMSMILIGYPVVLAAFVSFFSIYLSVKNKRKDRIFISYSAKDMDKVIKITNKIKELGYKPWLDIDEILPGQNISDEIKKAIESSSIFLVILSENYNSNFAAKEFELAMSIMRSNDKTFSPILPIIIGETPVSSIPEELKSIQWLDLRKNEEEGYKKLKEGLQRILGKEN